MHFDILLGESRFYTAIEQGRPFSQRRDPYVKNYLNKRRRTFATAHQKDNDSRYIHIFVKLTAASQVCNGWISMVLLFFVLYWDVLD